MDFTGLGDFTIHTVATDHTIGILHVPDSLATTALGDFLIHTVSLQVQVQVTLRLTVSQSVSLGIGHPPGAHDQIFIAPRLLRSCFCRAPSLTREDHMAINYTVLFQAISFTGVIYLASGLC
jgi:hypothetical protein